MTEKFWEKFMEQWDTLEETVFAKKVFIENREIYPVNKISILFKKTGEIATLSTIPLAWVIKEKCPAQYDKNADFSKSERPSFKYENDKKEIQYYMVLFDKENMNLIEEIIIQFKALINE